MNKRTFYIKALGLLVLSGVAKTAIQVVGQAVSAPETVVNHNYVQTPASTSAGITLAEDSERE